MKKFIFSLIAMLTLAIGVNAQSTDNYSGSSKFTDNWSVTVQGGVVSPFTDFYKNGSVTPIVLIGIDKQVNPWLSLGVDGRTSIGVGDKYNPHTVFDMVNVNGIAKVNLFNAFGYDGTRKTFEVNPYVAVGWTHVNCSDVPSISDNYSGVGVPTEYLTSFMRNSVAVRGGVELALNLGKEKANGIVLNLSDVWSNVDNMRLVKSNGHFEATLGWRHYFKTSNGTRTIAKAKLYDVTEVASLNARIDELRKENAALINARQHKPEPPHHPVAVVSRPDATYAVTFALNSAELSDTAKAILDKVPTNSIVDVTGSTSPEGTTARNTELAQERAQAIADYLTSRGVKVNSATSGETGRVGVVTIK